MALLPLTNLETHPVGSTNVAGIISGNWETLEAIAAANGFNRQAFAILAYASTITLDFQAARTRRTNLTGDVIVAFGTMATGEDVTLILKGDGSTRNLTWPASIVWLGAAAPATLAANKSLAVRFFSTGTTSADVFATWQVQP